jgi:hypothetical protein
VVLGWDVNSSVFDFDAALLNPLAHFEKSCWPVKFVARHVCCTSSMVLRIMQPVLMALMDRPSRSRIQVHNVPQSEIANALSRYGIKRSMLPTEMGGTVHLNPFEWIANRRAVEMEEI